jgi:7-cyano-7-deazaguanine synthase in queuosine biosynthesis
MILVSTPQLTYRQIQLNGLVDLLDSALVTGGDDVPEGHYAEDNMKATVVPNRNKIFASITQAVALSVANRTKRIVILQWASTQVITQFILIVDRNLEMQMMMLLE